MMTEEEKAKVKVMEETFHAMAVQMHGEDVSPELKAQFVGANMASLDAMFAIREGQPWRGMTDPKEIARALLRQAGIGE